MRKRTVLLACLVAFVGCRKKEPSSEIAMVPSHEEAGPQAAAGVAQSAGESFRVAGVLFTPSSGWRRQEPSSPMRAAQYILPGRGGKDGLLVVYYFGKTQGGSVAENIDRWEGQFTDASGKKASGTVKVTRQGGLQITTVSATGTYSSGMPGGPVTPEADSALWGLIVEGPEGNVFLKATGPRVTIEEQAPALEALRSSIRTGAESP